MKGTLIIIIAFCLGISFGFFSPEEWALWGDSLSVYTLCFLMFLVGFSIGGDKEKIKMLTSMNPLLLLVPLGTIVGTLLGSAIVSYFLSNRSLADCLAVGSGFGYYSLSSIIIAEYKGDELATVALMSNIIRELATIVLAPLWVLWFSPLALVSAGGATSMDTTMPFIARYAGEKFILIAIIHGVLVDLSVLVLVPFFCSF